MLKFYHLKGAASWLCAACILPCTHAAAEPEIKFPIVFSSPEVFEQSGISVRFAPPDNIYEQPKPAFPNACFEIQDEGGYYLSVSDQFLAQYKAEGFSLRSLCLALVSQVYFDPETGQRLPTYIVRDLASEQRLLDLQLKHLDEWSETDLKRYIPRYHKDIAAFKAAIAKAIEGYKNGDFKDRPRPEGLPKANIITDELAFAVPDCFKNATPYLDCTWRYGMKSGRKTTKALQKRFKMFGEAFDRLMMDYFKNGDSLEKLMSQEDASTIGMYLNGIGRYGTYAIEPNGFSSSEYYDGQPKALAIPIALLESIDFSFSLAHTDFPRGYGYALCATGEKDSGVSFASIEAAHDGSRHSSRLGSSLLKKIFKRN